MVDQSDSAARRRPIGYWLLRVHDLLEAHFAATLATQGLARRHWQVLNTLRRAPLSLHELRESLSHFDSDSRITTDTALAELSGKGWIVRNDQRLELSPAGTHAHRELAAKVEESRAVTCEGIDEADYVRTVDTLRRMADNLSRNRHRHEADTSR